MGDTWGASGIILACTDGMLLFTSTWISVCSCSRGKSNPDVLCELILMVLAVSQATVYVVQVNMIRDYRYDLEEVTYAADILFILTIGCLVMWVILGVLREVKWGRVGKCLLAVYGIANALWTSMSLAVATVDHKIAENSRFDMRVFWMSYDVLLYLTCVALTVVVVGVVSNLGLSLRKCKWLRWHLFLTWVSTVPLSCHLSFVVPAAGQSRYLKERETGLCRLAVIFTLLLASVVMFSNVRKYDDTPEVTVETAEIGESPTSSTGEEDEKAVSVSVIPMKANDIDIK